MSPSRCFNSGTRIATPTLDWHAIAPEIVLVVAICLLILADVVLLERARPIIGALAGLGLLAAVVPLITLAVSDVESRSLFGGAYVVDTTSLLLKASQTVSSISARPGA